MKNRMIQQSVSLLIIVAMGLAFAGSPAKGETVAGTPVPDASASQSTMQ